MKLAHALAAAAVLLLAGLATAQETKFTAELKGSNGVPPVQTSATGSFDMTCTEVPSDHTQDSCSWTLSVRGITDMTMAHIHQGGPTENGPVVVWLVPEEATAPADGKLTMLMPPVSGDQTFKGTFKSSGLGGPLAGTDLDSFRAGLTDGSIQAYVNVHTTKNPAGEIRGQVTKA